MNQSSRDLSSVRSIEDLFARSPRKGWADVVEPAIERKFQGGIVDYLGSALETQTVGLYVKRFLPHALGGPAARVTQVRQPEPVANDFQFSRVPDLKLTELRSSDGVRWNLLANKWPMSPGGHSMFVVGGKAHNFDFEASRMVADVLKSAPDANLLFQSFGAGGTVNDQHIHVMGQDIFPVLKAGGREQKFSSSDGEIFIAKFPEWPVPMFELSNKGGSRNDDLCKIAAEYAERLTDADIPHNFLFTNGRVLVAVRGIHAPASYGNLRVGGWEAFGIVKCFGDRELFESLDEATCETVLREQTQIEPPVLREAERMLLEAAEHTLVGARLNRPDGISPL